VAVQYEHPPIVEAVIDFRFDTAVKVDLATLEGLKQVLPGFVGSPRVVTKAHVRLELSGEPPAADTQSERRGYQFTSEDGREICLAEVDGFALIRLKPYQTWESFVSRARQLWQIYCAAVTVRHVNRVALRYINRIDITEKTFDTKDYFRTGPEISPVLPQQMDNFWLTLHLPQPDISGILVLNQGGVAPPESNIASIMLDIDVFCPGQKLSPEQPEIWEKLEALRATKNRYFEGCLTDRAKALFGEARSY
jgi:uncharacterized protein (TIGR04255 family)